MGSSVSTIVANLYKEVFEAQAIESAMQHPFSQGKSVKSYVSAKNLLRPPRPN